MSITFNHTIINASDKGASAGFLTELLGLESPKSHGRFAVVQVGGTSLDYATARADFQRQHYAFLVSEDEFDSIWDRIKARGLPFWADPHQQQPGEINNRDGGRGLYWQDPDGHSLEILTVPYGGWPESAPR